MKNEENGQKLGIALGAIAPPLHKQLEKQGFKYGKAKVKVLEGDITAFNRLRIRGYLPDSVADKVSQRLFNAIKDHVTINN